MSEPIRYPFNAVALKAAVREVAADRPDFKYEPEATILSDGGKGSTVCRYTEQDGTPGCIIGQGVFYITGETVNELMMGGGISHDRWAKALGVSYTVADDNYRAWVWLCSVQSYQDFKHTWSQAVARADAGYHADQATHPEEEQDAAEAEA